MCSRRSIRSDVSPQVLHANFRLLERLFPLIERVLKINDLDTITTDVSEAARSTLIIGTT